MKPLIFGIIFAPAGLAFPLVYDLVILQNHFYVGAILLLALRAPHVRHSRRFPSHVTSSSPSSAIRLELIFRVCELSSTLYICTAESQQDLPTGL